MKYLSLFGFALLFGCTNAASESAVEAQSSSSAVSSAPPLSSRAVCEFQLGAPVPQGQSALSKEVVPTEDGERVFYKYKACDSQVPVTMELESENVSAIDLYGNGNCLKGVACVGDSYGTVLVNYPQAKLFLSKAEGKSFALIIDDELSIKFSAQSLPDVCYDDQKTCSELILKSKIESIYLHER